MAITPRSVSTQVSVAYKRRVFLPRLVHRRGIEMRPFINVVIIVIVVIVVRLVELAELLQADVLGGPPIPVLFVGVEQRRRARQAAHMPPRRAALPRVPPVDRRAPLQAQPRIHQPALQRRVRVPILLLAWRRVGVAREVEEVDSEERDDEAAEQRDGVRCIGRVEPLEQDEGRHDRGRREADVIQRVDTAIC